MQDFLDERIKAMIRDVKLVESHRYVVFKNPKTQEK